MEQDPIMDQIVMDGFTKREITEIFDRYKSMATETAVYGEKHWKNPFKVYVFAKDGPKMLAAIKFYLGEKPFIQRTADGFWYFESNGYQC
jgi:hypothetical protein